VPQPTTRGKGKCLFRNVAYIIGDNKHKYNGITKESLVSLREIGNKLILCEDYFFLDCDGM
jgi:hypothetical protein